MLIDRRFQALAGIELPIILAPMAGPGTPELAISASVNKASAITVSVTWNVSGREFACDFMAWPRLADAPPHHLGPNMGLWRAAAASLGAAERATSALLALLRCG